MICWFTIQVNEAIDRANTKFPTVSIVTPIFLRLLLLNSDHYVHFYLARAVDWNRVACYPQFENVVRNLPKF